MTDSLRHLRHTHLTRLFDNARYGNSAIIAGIWKHFTAHLDTAGRRIDNRIDIKFTAFQRRNQRQRLHS